MSRITIVQDVTSYAHPRVIFELKLVYGYDRPLDEYFLQVYDNRFEWEEAETDEHNKIADYICNSGDGIILSMTTTTHSLGIKAEKRDIIRLLIAWEAPQEHIDAFKKGDKEYLHSLGTHIINR